MATVGSVLVKLGLDSAEFSKGVKGAQGSMDRLVNQSRRKLRALRKSVNNTGKSFISMGTRIALVAGPAGIGALTAASFSAIDAQKKFADRIGVSTKALSGLQLAASEMSGMVDSQTNMALQRMTRRIAEAANGTGEAKDAIKQLGLDAAALGKTPDEQFMRVADAMKGVASQGERVRLAFKLFDSEGVGLVNTLAIGSEGLQQFQKDAESLGIAVSSVDASKIEAANDAWGRVKSVFQGIGNIIAVEVAPLVKGLGDGFVDSAKRSEGFRDGVRDMVGNVAAFAGTIADVGRVWELFSQGLTIGILGLAKVWNDWVIMFPTALRDAVNAALVIFETWAKGIASAINGLAAPLNLIRSLMDMPPIEIDVQAIDLGRVDLGVTELEAKSETLSIALKQALQDYNNLAMAPPPSEEIIAGVERMRQAAQAGAESAGANTVNGGEGGLDEAEIAKRQANLESLREHLMSKEEIELAAFARRHEMLVQALDSELITKQKFLDLESKLEADHAQRLVGIQGKAAKERQNIDKQVFDSASGFLHQLAGDNKVAALAILAVEKGRGIAEVMINTQVASMRALAELGPIVGAPVAAAIQAKGALSAGLIAATGLFQAAGIGAASGGGSVSGGSAPATSNVVDFEEAKNISQPAPKFDVEIKGDLVSAEGVRELVTQIEDALSDGAGSGKIVLRGVGG